MMDIDYLGWKYIFSKVIGSGNLWNPQPCFWKKMKLKTIQQCNDVLTKKALSGKFAHSDSDEWSTVHSTCMHHVFAMHSVP